MSWIGGTSGRYFGTWFGWIVQHVTSLLVHDQKFAKTFLGALYASDDEPRVEVLLRTYSAYVGSSLDVFSATPKPPVPAKRTAPLTPTPKVVAVQKAPRIVLTPHHVFVLDVLVSKYVGTEELPGYVGTEELPGYVGTKQSTEFIAT